MKYTSLILPVIVCSVVIFGFVKRVKVFDCFSQGALKGFKTAVSLLPVLTGLNLAVSVFMSSEASVIFSEFLSPVFTLLGIPEEVIPLCLLSPVSGSGSLAVYEQILNDFGPDSFQGRVASVIAGATETTFYAVTVYLGSSGIRKSANIIPCALFGDILSFALAALSVRLFF